MKNWIKESYEVDIYDFHWLRSLCFSFLKHTVLSFYIELQLQIFSALYPVPTVSSTQIT